MSFCPKSKLLAIAISLAALSSATATWAQDAASLQARHEAQRRALAASPFQRPLLIETRSSSTTSQGQVDAVLAYPFDTVARSFREADTWCDILMLQLNVKACHVDAGGDGAHGTALEVAIGKKIDQPLREAYQVRFDHRLAAARADHLSVQINAADGPLGTHDHRLTLQAVPVDGSHTYIQMAYSYRNGPTARWATQAYLATIGRNKVGFTVVGRDANGRNLYVDGVQGIAERNAMRYFLAIEAWLDALASPPADRAERRLRQWFEATERYPRQLHEIEMADYLTMKRRQRRSHDAAPDGPAEPHR
ncbi:hypothetical protein AACH06_21775 [Ideonella sp. DXS29W]|uniref:Uncharacterized protein n=1 Tax=Ideonella lacteola TaxID=2984193 RepID=A0ABU9BU12_9BURK